MPSDITGFCPFKKPDPEKSFEFGLGCTNIIFLPGIGFTTNSTEAADAVGRPTSPAEEEAFDAIVQYCDCYNAYEQGCAAAIPHGPPTQVDYGSGQVLVNSYSEFIPFSSPAARAEYCLFVGVWNGDMDADDVYYQLDPTVQTCGCHWIGQARQMVGECPGIELGAFFEPPVITNSPTISPKPTPKPTPMPTPESGLLYNETFDSNNMFPDDYPMWTTGGGLVPPDILPVAGDRRRLHRHIAKEGVRRLQNRNDDPDPYFHWMISDDQSFSPTNSISPPNLMNSTKNENMTTAFSYAMFETDENWGEGTFKFHFWTDINPNDPNPPYHEIDVFYTADDPVNFTDLVFNTDLGNTQDVTDPPQGWDDHDLLLPSGKHFVIISYVFNPTGDSTLVVPNDYMPNLYIDNVKYEESPGGQRMMRTRRSNTQ